MTQFEERVEVIERAREAVEARRVREEQEELEQRQQRKARKPPALEISLQDRERIIAEQGGACPICGVELGTLGKGKVHLDHNHETLKVRGVLCLYCNVAIGHLRVDTLGDQLLVSAIEYLKRPEVRVEKYIRGSTRIKALEPEAVSANNEWDFS